MKTEPKISIKRRGGWWDLSNNTVLTRMYYSGVAERALSIYSASTNKLKSCVGVVDSQTGLAVATIELSHVEVVVHHHDPSVAIEYEGAEPFLVFQNESEYPYVLWDMERRKWRLWFLPRATTLGTSWMVRVYGALFPQALPVSRYGEVWRMCLGFPIKQLKGFWVNEA